ncbi:ankyrin repeats (3 copies) domain-containing protein [Hirsutella rhossiliensis]|uniref:Ankyrin repeats (3 copies) domain-containing protein n=1 Tax=Hirsutella rhossiliensis TaxID=111463 RepID=A0A9P8MNE1_9HYPO|nr:ankyrin repeats (3 copies) domain-containing protein [Hirsutella rhossiliensis]KAH0958472.1 ankyrin repeats (3 copies) domain-containing protein [Hirsutella rhossiliensis]
MQPADTQAPTMVSDDMEEIDFMTALTKATKGLNLCPNRVWAVAGRNLSRLMPAHIPAQGHNDEYENHELCTYDLCEYSQRDFTSVAQRHECRDSLCEPLQGPFSRDALHQAAMTGNSTVWRLDGASLVQPPQPYMAISHVWSDGTGTGDWTEGEVNECLFGFFSGIASQFQCDGIWWDTLCIPREKAARSKAIRKIQRNYQDARFTLVHDCFLRNWEWNAENACFALLMSPWFSRGWTALELAKSPKVKVIFRGPSGPLIKDLDDQILANDDGCSDAHKRASDIIRRLRRPIETLDDLLAVLGPRHTSWPKDKAIISGLLVDLDMKSLSLQHGIWQQHIYQGILRKMGKISPGCLFHNAATMSRGFSWCPVDLYKMPRSPSEASLTIDEKGNAIGMWRVIRMHDALQQSFLWNGVHHLTQERLVAALRCPARCVLLAEPGTGPVGKALLVKAMEHKGMPMTLCCQYVGQVWFRQETAQSGNLEDCIEMEAVVLGDVDDELAMATWNAWALVENLQARMDAEDSASKERASTGREEPRNGTPGIALAKVDDVDAVSQRTALHDAIWRGDDDVLLAPGNPRSRDGIGQEPLHLAAERGLADMALSLLNKADSEAERESMLESRCHQRQTALHRGAWGGSVAVVELLLRSGSKTNKKDKGKKIPLHIAAEKGHAAVVRLLLRNKREVYEEDLKTLTSLHYAAMHGHAAVARLLLEAAARIDTKDRIAGWTALHHAAYSGHHEVVKLLLAEGADAGATDDMVGWTPLHMAAMSGRPTAVELLVSHGAVVDARDSKGWTPRRLAAAGRHEAVVKLLPGEDADEGFDERDVDRWTTLHCLAIEGQQQGLVPLMGVPLKSGDNSKGWTPLHCAAKNGLRAVAQLLLMGEETAVEEDDGGRKGFWQGAGRRLKTFKKASVPRHGVLEARNKGGRTPLQLAAKTGQAAIARLLLETGANQDAKDLLQATPLHLTTVKTRSGISEWGQAAVARLLVEAGANKETRDHSNLTPLGRAAASGHYPVARLLVGAGADKEAKTKTWKTPLFLASANDHKQVSRLLIEAGANKEDARSVLGVPRPFAKRLGQTAGYAAGMGQVAVGVMGSYTMGKNVKF